MILAPPLAGQTVESETGVAAPVLIGIFPANHKSGSELSSLSSSSRIAVGGGGNAVGKRFQREPKQFWNSARRLDSVVTFSIGNRGLSSSVVAADCGVAHRGTIWAITGSRLASPSTTRPAPEAKPDRAACIRSRSCFRPRATNGTIASRARTNLMSASPRRPISNALSDGSRRLSLRALHRTFVGSCP